MSVNPFNYKIIWKYDLVRSALSQEHPLIVEMDRRLEIFPVILSVE